MLKYLDAGDPRPNEAVIFEGKNPCGAGARKPRLPHRTSLRPHHDIGRTPMVSPIVVAEPGADGRGDDTGGPVKKRQRGPGRYCSLIAYFLIDMQIY